MKKKPVLRLGLPKGSLQEATIETMGKAGFNITVSSRSYTPYVDDEELELSLIHIRRCRRPTLCRTPVSPAPQKKHQRKPNLPTHTT